MAERQSAMSSSNEKTPSTRCSLPYSAENTDNEQKLTDRSVQNISTNQSQNAVGGSESARFQSLSNDGQSSRLAREDHAKTVDEIFAFINEGFSTNENIPKERSSSAFDFGSSSQHSYTTSVHDKNIVSSPGFKSGNIVNFNRQESLKVPNPEKEIDEFLPEEKTVDLPLTTESWKGRKPPSQLVEIEIDDIPHSLTSVPLTSKESKRKRSDSFQNIPRSDTYVEVGQQDALEKSDKPTSSRRIVNEDLGRLLQVKIPLDLKVNPTKTTKKRRKSPSSSQALAAKQSIVDEISPSKHHRKTKEKGRDTVNATEEFDIYGRVTQGQTPLTNSASTSKRHEPGKFHVRVDSQDPRLSLVPYNLFNTPEPSTKEENIKVYVNVNVNMNKDKNRSTLNDFDYGRFARPMLTENDLSDRSSSTLSENGYENSEFDSSTISDRSLDMNQLSPNHTNIPPFLPPNDLSHLTIDRFRMVHKLGPGGLSPIPSESYESDTAHFPSDFSDLKQTPSNSDNSSDSTIKGIAVVGDFDDEDKVTRVASTRGSGKTKPRKISFENDKFDNDRYYGRSDNYKRSRSYSQPEQYLLDKRQNAFNKMEMGLPSEYHKRLGKTPSDPVSEEQKQNTQDFDQRFPFSFRQHKRSIGEEFLGDDESVLSRQDSMWSSWNPRSPYSSRVRRSSSILSDSSRAGRRMRQLSIDIGEEWENIHQPIRPRTTSDVGSISSGFSYRSLRTKQQTEMLVGTEAMSFRNVPYREKPETIAKPGAMVTDDIVPDDMQVTEEIESPVADISEDVNSMADVRVTGPVVIEVGEPESEFGERSPKVRFLLDNPYNSINQKFHAALHCPCFLFFCFLCCAPAVYWMQRSDYEFDYASEKLAKRYGRRATVLYITGIVLSILLFSAAIATTYLLLETELLRKGHLK